MMNVISKSMIGIITKTKNKPPNILKKEIKPKALSTEKKIIQKINAPIIALIILSTS